MPPKILRGSREHCLTSLREDRFDLEEYPLNSYAQGDTFTIAEQEARIYQGVNPVPQARFQVSLDEDASLHAGLSLPGVVPFLVSAFQASGRRRVASPKPAEVGLPLLTTEDDYLIRWMFGKDGERHAGHTLWRRLTGEELQALPDAVCPDETVEPDARTGQGYQHVSGGTSAPEPAVFVQPRAGGLPHEPWMARSVELAETWRVVVPNTSVDCRPVVVPPTLTIVGQNFNIILCPTPEIAIAIGVVLSRKAAVEFLTGISPWAAGDTPRPRSKHVNATLWSFEQHINDLLENENARVASLQEQLEEVWKIHVTVALSIARRDNAPGQPLRDRYRAMEPRESLEKIPAAILDLEDRVLTLGAGDDRITIEFATPEEAALGAVAVWTAIPRQMSLDHILGLRFERGVCQRPTSIRELLIEKTWSQLVGEEEIQDLEDEQDHDND